MKVIDKHDKILGLFYRSLFIFQLSNQAAKLHDKSDLEAENQR